MDLKYQHQNISYSTYVKFIFDGFKILKISQKGSKSANDLVLLGMGYDVHIQKLLSVIHKCPHKLSVKVQPLPWVFQSC